MHAKQASVPWEDEKFAYLIATKRRFEPAQARIIRPPRQLKHGLELYLCTPHGLQQQTIARRDKAAYRLAHKLVWGDRFPASTAKEYADDT